MSRPRILRLITLFALDPVLWTLGLAALVAWLSSLGPPE